MEDKTNLIDDIIDVAKIEANELTITIKESNISELVKNIEINFNQLKIDKKKSHIEIKSYIPQNAKDLIILTDELRLRQVLTNLLSNSLKFSDKGEISFGFELHENEIEFYVKDEGIGIPKNKLEEIFDRFKQVNYNDNAKFGGTGLGLSISKGIIKKLGGKISVDSILNQGTVFKFTIPFKRSTKKNMVEKTIKKPIKNNSMFFENKTILIAEDDAIIQLLYKKYFQNTGVNTIYATTGKQAVEEYTKKSNIDVILMDIRMPEMNGFDASTEILKINPDAKIIVQSAYAMHDEKEKCFKIGCKDYLTKPINKNDLFTVLQKWI